MLERICEARSAERLSADPRARAFTITDWIVRHIDTDAATLGIDHPAPESAPPPGPRPKPAKPLRSAGPRSEARRISPGPRLPPLPSTHLHSPPHTQLSPALSAS